MGNLCREPPELVGEEYGRRVIVQAHPRHCCCCCCGPTATATAAAAARCAHSSGLLLGRGCGRQGGIHPVVDSQALEGAAGGNVAYTLSSTAKLSKPTRMYRKYTMDSGSMGSPLEFRSILQHGMAWNDEVGLTGLSEPSYLSTYPPNLRTYLPTYQNTYLPTHPPTYLPTYLPTYPTTYLSTYLPNYLPTYLPTHLPLPGQPQAVVTRLHQLHRLRTGERRDRTAEL